MLLDEDNSKSGEMRNVIFSQVSNFSIGIRIHVVCKNKKYFSSIDKVVF